MSEDYCLNDTAVKALVMAISEPRLSTYLAASFGNVKKAIRLHAWNTDISAALFGPVLNAELLIRNSCDVQLATLYDRPDWYNVFPDQRGYGYLRAQVAEAQYKMQRLGRDPYHPPQVIANVSFGFWVALFEKHLHRDLWVPALRRVFPHRPPGYDRSAVWDSLRKIRDMRNRIAHHEPLFNRDLPGFEAELLELAACICPETSAWIGHCSKFQEVWLKSP
jgi:hypothetical protein